MSDFKIQMVCGTWHYFYGGRMLDLGERRPRTAEEAAGLCGDRIKEFREETDARAKQILQPKFTTK